MEAVIRDKGGEEEDSDSTPVTKIAKGLQFITAGIRHHLHPENEMQHNERQARAPLRQGDHLISSRLGYDHHGIYIGGGLVIHYSGFANGIGSDGEICYASLDEFRNGSDLRIKPHPAGSYDREVIIDRAHQRLGENWYNLLLNNCEHFAHWCVRGVHASPQVNVLIHNAALAYGLRNSAAQQLTQIGVRQMAAKSATQAVSSVVAGSATRSLATTGLGLGSALLSGTALGTLSTVVTPVPMLLAAGYCLKELYDWF